MFNRTELLRSLSAIGIQPEVDLFAELASAYGSDSRFYHTGEHIADCLRQFGKYRKLASHPHEIEIAIWFHDAIYDTRESDNEELSALWAQRYLEAEGASSGVVRRVSQMILASKTHTPDSPDSALFVDIDLSILGASPKRFDRYNHAIRLEYEWVPQERYRVERVKVLQSFLDRDTIYHTKNVRAKLEARARQNLNGKIHELST